MADNTTLDSGSGGDTIASDDIADAGVANGAKVQRVKAGFGSDGNYADPTGGAGAVDAGTARVVIASNQTAVPVSATALPLPTGAATNAAQLPDGHAVTVDNASIAVTAASLPLPTGAATNAAQLPDGHAVTVDNASIAVTAATLPLPAGAATSAAQLPDGHAVAAAGAAAENAAASGNPVLSGGRYDAISRVLGDGDVGALAVDVSGHLITNNHANPVELTDNVSNTLNVVVDETETFVGSPTFPFAFDGMAWARQRGDSVDGLLVNLGANNDVSVASLPLPAGAATSAAQLPDGHAVTVDNASIAVTAAALPLPSGAATNAAQLPDGHAVTVDNASIAVTAATLPLPSGAATSAAQLPDGHQVTVTNLVFAVVGQDAHDSAASGDTFLQGLEARTTNPTAVGNGDAVRAMADDTGKQIVRLNAPRDLIVRAQLSHALATEVTLLATGGAGVFHDLLLLTLSNLSATKVTAIIRDTTAGGAVFEFSLAADGGGAIVSLATPMPQAAANTNWTLELSAALAVEATIMCAVNV